MGNIEPLEAFIDESLRLSSVGGYPATTFRRMRRDHGTVEAIKRLVRSGEIQTGFHELRRLKLLDWSIESAAVKFPEQFDVETIECAKFRLAHAGDKKLRGNRY